jgi:hypothetical protein
MRPTRKETLPVTNRPGEKDNGSWNKSYTVLTRTSAVLHLEAFKLISHKVHCYHMLLYHKEVISLVQVKCHPSVRSDYDCYGAVLSDVLEKSLHGTGEDGESSPILDITTEHTAAGFEPANPVFKWQENKLLHNVTH